MKKETILNILSLAVVVGAVLLELMNYRNETGVFSIRLWMMKTATSATNVVDGGSVQMKNTTFNTTPVLCDRLSVPMRYY